MAFHRQACIGIEIFRNISKSRNNDLQRVLLDQAAFQPVVARFNGYDDNGDPIDASVKASGSYLATADYYFTDHYSIRPFAGAGAGIFTIAGVESTSSSDKVSVGSKFGGMVRAGVELSHFRFGVEYNIVPKTSFSGYDSDGNPTDGLTSGNSYIGIKIGVCFGGGRR